MRSLRERQSLAGNGPLAITSIIVNALDSFPGSSLSFMFSCTLDLRGLKAVCCMTRTVISSFDNIPKPALPSSQCCNKKAVVKLPSLDNLMYLLLRSYSCWMSTLCYQKSVYRDSTSG